MNSEVRNADKILILCSPTYQKNVYEMEDGIRATKIGYEYTLITNSWYLGGARGKLIPVLVKGNREESIPNFGQGLESYDLSSSVFNEVVYRNLLQHLYDVRPVAPSLGDFPAEILDPKEEPIRGPGYKKTKIKPDNLVASSNVASRKSYDVYIKKLQAEITYLLDRLVHFYVDLSGEPVNKGVFVKQGFRMTSALPSAFFEGISTKTKQAPDKFDSFEEAFSFYENRLILTGQPGSGKTTTLLSFARSIAQRCLDNQKFPIPVLGRLSTWEREKDITLEDWLSEHVPGLSAYDIKYLIEKKRVLLLLDGLDEIRSLKGEREAPMTQDPRKKLLEKIPEGFKC